MLIRLNIAIDNAEFEKRLRRQLSKQQDIRIEILGSKINPWQRLVRSNADIFIIDSNLVPQPIESSIAVLNDLPENPTTILLHDSDAMEDQAMLVAAGADVVLYSELAFRTLIEAIESTLESRRNLISRGLHSGPLEYVPRLSDFASDSPMMQLFIDTVERIVSSNSPVLITGETGVGKEHLAKAIHSESPRSAGPFMAVNCAAIPETLLESELFGHEEGAFTGATRSRRGAFELAHKGTLLLDEIGEMPIHLQVKLLRVLQDYEIRPLGSEKSNFVDVRIIAATNKSLEEEVKNKTFRNDLYYRLSVVSLTIPPLRERPEDIPWLVQHYIDITRRRIGREVYSITNEAIEALCQYDWPGNIRELMNVIERAILLCPEEEIDVKDLPHNFQRGWREDPSNLNYLPKDSSSWKNRTLPEVCSEIISKVEKDYLTMVLTQTNGRISKAAQIAGIHSRAMYNKMKKYNLNKKDFRK